MQRRLAAILHADVAGYSRLMAGDEEGTLARLKSRLDVLKEAIANHSGRICNTAGDAVLAEFPSVSAAVFSAVEVQRRIARLNEGLPNEQRLDLRIGINLGEVMAEDDGQVYGTGVNVAARLQALAEPGHITISGRAREQIDPALGISVASLGQHRVKNIPTPVNVFRIVAEGARPWRPRASRGPRRLSYWIVGAACVAVLGVSVAIVNRWTDLPRSVPRNAGEGMSEVRAATRLAILPFRNATGDRSQDYFAEAITEDLTAALGRFAEIGVIASEAMVGVDDRTTPEEIHRKHGVAYLVSGSVRRDGEGVRLVVKLIDAKSGQQLWSERYDRPIAELFEVQDEIVRTVAGEAAVTLGRIETERVLGKAIPDLEAYDLYVRGRALIARETRDDNIEARALFRQAVRKDPRYALAHVGLAWTYYREMTRGWSQFATRNVDEAEQLVRHALELDPNLSEAYELLGWTELLRGDYELSEAALRKAINLNPNSLGALQALGNTLLFLGDAQGAIQAMEKSVSLGARSSSRSLSILGLAYVLSDDPKRAIQFLETHARGRRDHFYYATLAVAHSELGDEAEAASAAEQTLRAWPFFKVEEFVHQFRDQRDQQRLADGLRRAGLR